MCQYLTSEFSRLFATFNFSGPALLTTSVFVLLVDASQCLQPRVSFALPLLFHILLEFRRVTAKLAPWFHFWYVGGMLRKWLPHRFALAFFMGAPSRFVLRGHLYSAETDTQPRPAFGKSNYTPFILASVCKIRPLRGQMLCFIPVCVVRSQPTCLTPPHVRV